MAIQTTLNYDQSGNFTFDTNKVEFVSSSARLKNDGQSDAQTFSDTFDSATGKTFSATDVEITGGVARLKDQATTDTYTEDFNDATGLTFDTNKVEISGGAQAQLKFVDNTGQTFDQDFSSSTGFTFDSSDTEFTGGVLQQLDNTPADSVLGATYTTDVNANWNTDGSTTGTVVGGAAVSGGKLDCKGNTNDGVSYDIDNNDGQAAIKFKYTPNYTGNPPNNIDVIGIAEPSGNNNRIRLTHSPSGDTWRIWLNNNIGTALYTATTIGSSGVGLTSGTEYEIELNWDNVAGTIRLFQDGALHGTLSPGAWDFTSNAAEVRVGAALGAYSKAEAEFDDVVFFSTVQHTAAYTSGYSLPETVYIEDTITFPQFSYTGGGSVQTFTALATVGETGSPRFNMNGLYWSGAAWVSSDDSYAQMNDSATINTNIGTLPASDTLDVKMGTVSNNTQEAISNFQVTYTGQEYATDNPTIDIDTALTNTNTISSYDSFTETIGTSGSDAVQYQLSDDNGSTFKYWSGAAWVTASGYAQSNSGSDVNTNIGTFPITASGIKVKVFLHSDDGTTTPNIGNLSIGYTKEEYVTTNPTIVYDADNITNSFTSVEFTSFTETSIKTGSDEIKYTLSTDSGTTFQYWTGSAWANADNTYAQSSTASDINTNIGTLDNPNNTLLVKIFLHSADDTTTPQLQTLQIGYNDIKYATDEPTVVNNVGQVMDALTEFSETVTKPSGTDIQYIVTVDSQDKYWSGAAWVNSDGTFAQSNTAAVINTNASSLDLSSGHTVKFKALLDSDGTDTPILTSLTYGYSFFISEPTSPNTCVVYGFLKDIGLTNVSGATVTIYGDTIEHGSFLISNNKSTTTNSSGYFEFTLVETATVTQTVNFRIESTVDSKAETFNRRGITVPNQVSANITELI